MSHAPMLADFAIRLSFGLVLALILTPWQLVPLRFFRIQNQVILGTMVLAALDQGRSSGPSWPLWLAISGATAAYLATISWGLGLPKIGMAAGLLGTMAMAAWIVLASRSDHAGFWAFNALSRCASGLLLGATLSAMLLGHYYLIAPAMTIDPLKRSLNLIAVGLAARAVLAGIGLWVERRGTHRIGMGCNGPGHDLHRHAMGDRNPGDGRVDLPGATDRRDPIDTIGDGNPLHHLDLRPVRGVELDRGRRPRDSRVRSARRPVVILVVRSGSPPFRCLQRVPLSPPTGSITM